MPAATVKASCPAPDIWKKIFCWCLSRISRSSMRRERYIRRYISTNCWRLSPSYVFSAALVAGLSATADAVFFDSALVMAMALLVDPEIAWYVGTASTFHFKSKLPPGYTENNDPQEPLHSRSRPQTTDFRPGWYAGRLAHRSGQLSKRHAPPLPQAGTGQRRDCQLYRQRRPHAGAALIGRSRRREFCPGSPALFHGLLPRTQTGHHVRLRRDQRDAGRKD